MLQRLLIFGPFTGGRQPGKPDLRGFPPFARHPRRGCPPHERDFLRRQAVALQGLALAKQPRMAPFPPRPFPPRMAPFPPIQSCFSTRQLVPNSELDRLFASEISC